MCRGLNNLLTQTDPKLHHEIFSLYEVMLNAKEDARVAKAQIAESERMQEKLNLQLSDRNIQTQQEQAAELKTYANNFWVQKVQ